MLQSKKLLMVLLAGSMGFATSAVLANPVLCPNVCSGSGNWGGLSDGKYPCSTSSDINLQCDPNVDDNLNMFSGMITGSYAEFSLPPNGYGQDINGGKTAGSQQSACATIFNNAAAQIEDNVRQNASNSEYGYFSANNWSLSGDAYQTQAGLILYCKKASSGGGIELFVGAPNGSPLYTYRGADVPSPQACADAGFVAHFCPSS